MIGAGWSRGRGLLAWVGEVPAFWQPGRDVKDSYSSVILLTMLTGCQPEVTVCRERPLLEPGGSLGTPATSVNTSSSSLFSCTGRCRVTVLLKGPAGEDPPGSPDWSTTAAAAAGGGAKSFSALLLEASRRPAANGSVGGSCPGSCDGGSAVQGTSVWVTPGPSPPSTQSSFSCSSANVLHLKWFPPPPAPPPPPPHSSFSHFLLREGMMGMEGGGASPLLRSWLGPT